MSKGGEKIKLNTSTKSCPKNKLTFKEVII